MTKQFDLPFLLSNLNFFFNRKNNLARCSVINECLYQNLYSSDGDPFISRKLILIHISRAEDLILHFFIKYFLSVLKISKKFSFLIKNVRWIFKEMWTRNYFIDPFSRIRCETDLFYYSPDDPKKKTSVLDFCQSRQKMFHKN